MSSTTTTWSPDSNTNASDTVSSVDNVSLTGTLSVTNNSANPLYVSTTDDNPLKLERTGSSANVSIQFKNDEGDPWYMGKASNGGFGISDGGADLASATYSKVYIDSSGNVGIGTTSPSKTLSIHAGSGGQVAINREDADNAIIANDEIGRISFGGDDPTNETFQVGAAILVAGDGTWASNDCPARIQFYTCDDGSNTLDARMTIKENGSIGIGTASPSGTQMQVEGNHSSGYAAKFVNDGDNSNRNGILITCGKDTYSSSTAGEAVYINFQDGNGTGQGGIYNSTNLDLPQFYEASDSRIKENIADTKIDALSILNQFKMREFNKIGDSKISIGLVAQEVKDVMPELVSTVSASDSKWIDNLDNSLVDSDGNKLMYTIGTGILPYYFIKAIQELSSKVTALESA